MSGRVTSRRPKPGRAMLSICLVSLCCAMFSCGGGGAGPPITGCQFRSTFASSGTVSSPDSVRLTGSGPGREVTVNVVIAGPTTSADLYSFAFDLVLGDVSVVRYADGSAVFGSALTIDPGQGQQVLVSQNGDRVTVGVTKSGGGSGNAIGGSEETIVSLTFDVVTCGMTSVAITGSPPNDPAALDSTGTVVPGVQFDVAGAVISVN